MTRKVHPGAKAAAFLDAGLSWDQIAKKMRMPRKRAYNFWYGWTHREERKQWYLDNQTSHKATCAAYRVANRDVILANKRIAGKEETVRDRKARQASKKSRERDAAYRDANREKLRASCREIYRRDIEASRLRHRIRNSNRRHGDEWGPVHRAALDLRTACDGEE